MKNEKKREYQRAWYKAHRAELLEKAKARRAEKRKRKALEKPEAAPETEAKEPVPEPVAAEWSRFELVVDGVRYFARPEEDGCDGCAFCHCFGNRQRCMAEGSDFDAARHVCSAIGGQWHESEVQE
jgi:hypothetical protein